MSPASNSILSLILIALGLLGIILSYTIADKKKSTISMVMAVAIIVVGLYTMLDQSVKRWQIERRMNELQKQSQVDIEALRQKMKEQAKAGPMAPKKP